MFETEKALLRKLCQKSNSAREAALCDELERRGIRFENREHMAVVVPSSSKKPVLISAHFDSVEGSFGYNDNGMGVMTVLELIGQLPDNVEIVFTNHEEKGALGAQYYLQQVNKEIAGCVNVDVVGAFDQIYIDPMNCHAAAKVFANCKQGTMPFSDACIFAGHNIPSVCFSCGPGESDFRHGITAIFSTIHNNHNDNNFDLLNFEMISQVQTEVKNAVNLLAA